MTLKYPQIICLWNEVKISSNDMFVEYNVLPCVSARNNDARPLIIFVNAEHSFMLVAYYVLNSAQDIVD